jgi:hypothetical protein
MTPDSFLWWRYRCRECSASISRPRGHGLPPNDPRNPSSLCELCKVDAKHVAQGEAPRYENCLGPDPERDQVAGRLIDSAFDDA